MILAPDHIITPHFRMNEFAVSAAHPDLVVDVPIGMRPTVVRLVRDVLEPIRLELRRPMRIISGYRSLALNRAVKGSVSSQHRRAEAGDWTCDRIREAFATVLDMVADHRLPNAGQIIYYPAKHFIHAALTSTTYQVATCCVHWPERGISDYRVITPSYAAFNKLVPSLLDPSRA